MNEQTDASCRICLDTNVIRTVSLFDNIILEKFEYCLNLMVPEEDCAPKTLCEKCADMLFKYSDFKELCIKSDIFWKSLLTRDSVTNIYSETVKLESDFCDDIHYEHLEKKEVLELIEPEDNFNIDIKSRTRTKKSDIISTLKNGKRKLKEFAGQCDYCKKEFSYRNALKTHILTCQLVNNSHHEVSKLPPSARLPINDILYCGLCDTSSSDRNIIKSHLQEHECNNELLCKHCDYSGVDFADILGHRFNHQPKEFRLLVYCHLCNKAYKMAKKLEFHYRGEHMRKKPGLCNICGNTFATYKHWRKHVNAHAGTNYRCDLCGRYFMYKSDLASHMTYHSVDKSFVCHLCGFSCRLASGLRSHIARHHGNNKPVRCAHCNKIFKNAMTLKDHIARVAGELNYACHVCSKKFKTERLLNLHMFWHTGDKPHVCSTCGNAYKSKCSLKSHIRSHTGERPFRCDVCLSAFRSSNVLKNHRRTHTGEKQYKCTRCDQGFNVKKMLAKHMERHEKVADSGV